MLRVAAVLLLFLFILPGIGWAAPPSEQDLWLGWQGHVVLGCRTEAVYDVAVKAVGDGAKFRLDVAASDPDGNLATFTGDEVSLDANHRRLFGSFQLGRPDGPIFIRVYRDGTLWQERGPIVAGQDAPLGQTHTQAEQLLITVGLPDGVQALFDPSAPGRRTVLHYADCAELPVHDLAYDGVAGLLLAGSSLPNAEQSAAIERWVRRGGRLLVSVGAEPKEFRETPLAQWLPVSIDSEPVPTRELTSLELYAGKTVRVIPTGTRVLIPKFTYSAGKSLAGNRGDSVLIQVPHAFGSVTLLGMDVTRPALKEWPGLKDWPGLADLLRKMTGTGEGPTSASAARQQLGSTGITELASQVSAALERFDSISRTSPWWVLGGLIVLMALIGPLDYWLVTQIWRTPFATWISFPLLLAASASAAIWAAGTANGDKWLLNQLDVIDVDAASGAARGTHWMTLYSPEASACRVQVRPGWTAWSQADPSATECAIGWSGLPENSFGGMYRSGSGGLQFGQAPYTIEPDAGIVRDLPLAQWSTAALGATSEAALPDLVESKLTSSATGRLAGTLTHRLPGPLTDWFLTYAGKIYRVPAKVGSEAVAPLDPQQVFRVDQPSVLQRELRGYLTRTTAREVLRSKEKTSGELVLEQIDYDPLARDLTGILPILSFHGNVGGGAYTGLSNDALAIHDLSPLLDLDRAIVFGYLDRPALDAELPAGMTPTVRRLTLVRVVLPVDRSKQAPRELPKFEPK